MKCNPMVSITHIILKLRRTLIYSFGRWDYVRGTSYQLVAIMIIYLEVFKLVIKNVGWVKSVNSDLF